MQIECQRHFSFRGQQRKGQLAHLAIEGDLHAHLLDHGDETGGGQQLASAIRQPGQHLMQQGAHRLAAIGVLQTIGQLPPGELPLQQGAPANRPLLLGRDAQRLLVEKETTLLLQSSPAQRLLGLLLDLQHRLPRLIANGSDIQAPLRIHRLGPAQALQLVEQLFSRRQGLLFGKAGQQDGQPVARVTTLNGPGMALQEMTDELAAALQPFDGLRLPLLPQDGLHPLELQQHHGTNAVIGIAHRRLEAVVEEEAVADAQLFIDEDVAANEGVETSALLAGIGQLALQMAQGLAGAARPLQLDVVPQLPLLTAQNVLPPARQELNPQQLAPQPVQRGPQPEPDSQQAKPQATQRRIETIELTQRRLNKKTHMQRRVTGTGVTHLLQLIGVQVAARLLVVEQQRIIQCHGQLLDAVGPQQGRQPALQTRRFILRQHLVLENLNHGPQLLTLKAIGQRMKTQSRRECRQQYGTQDAQAEQRHYLVG